MSNSSFIIFFIFLLIIFLQKKMFIKNVNQIKKETFQEYEKELNMKKIEIEDLKQQHKEYISMTYTEKQLLYIKQDIYYKTILDIDNIKDNPVLYSQKIEEAKKYLYIEENNKIIH